MTSNSGINKLLEKIIFKLSPYFIKIEITLLVIVLLAVLLKIGHFSGSVMLITIGLSSFTILYFLKASDKNNSDNNPMTLFLNKIFYWGLAISTHSTLFILQRWPGGSTLYILGLLTTSIALIGITILYVKNRNSKEKDMFFKPKIIRGVVIITILLSLYLFGDTTEYRKVEKDEIKAPIENINE